MTTTQTTTHRQRQPLQYRQPLGQMRPTPMPANLAAARAKRAARHQALQRRATLSARLRRCACLSPVKPNRWSRRRPRDNRRRVRIHGHRAPIDGVLERLLSQGMRVLVPARIGARTGLYMERTDALNAPRHAAQLWQLASTRTSGPALRRQPGQAELILVQRSQSIRGLRLGRGAGWYDRRCCMPRGHHHRRVLAMGAERARPPRDHMTPVGGILTGSLTIFD